VGKSGNRLVVFKQFSVRDDRCAMKVGTDALLLGSWSQVEHAEWVADIGTGSGIVALMAAQRASRARVVGVELEPQATIQANENFGASPFATRIQGVHSSAQDFALDPANQGKFDVVLSNPPFFTNKPKSPHPEMIMSRHDEALPLKQLLNVAFDLLKNNGRFQLVWPFDRKDELEVEAVQKGFVLDRVTAVCGSIHRDPNRLLMSWMKDEQKGDASEQTPQMERMHIEEGLRKDGQPVLSPAYIQLLKPYRDL